MRLSELCIRHPIATTLLMLAMVLVGIAGYRELPVAALPAIDFPTIQVTASLPGASPDVMAASVATPLEQQLSAIPGVTSLTSSSTLGSSQIVLQFELDRSIDAAALDVQSAISVAQRSLPKQMTTPPSFRKVDPSAQPVVLLALTSDLITPQALDEYGEVLIGQQLSSLPGVAQVTVYGAKKYAVRIVVDPGDLAATGLAATDVATAVANQTTPTPLGSLISGQSQQTLVIDGRKPDATDFRRMVIAEHQGIPIRLDDIAKVENGVENDQTGSWFNGKPAIVVAIQREPGANTVAVVDAVKSMLPIFRAELPPSVNVSVVNDASVSIRQSVADVQFSLGLAVALVVMVIFIFLRSFRATLIPTLALPASVVGTFAGMYVLGYSLDNLSLMALTLSVGFVVDDAIVMLENIVRHVEMGKTPFQAAIDGSKEIGFTILSITMSLVAVFIPVLFMGGIVGRLFHEFAVTISIAILASGFVSLTLSPMLCARLLKPHKEGEGHDAKPRSLLFRISEGAFDGMLAGYRRTLDWILAHQTIALIGTVATFAVTAWLFVIVPKGFFPIEDTGRISVNTQTAQGSSFEATAAIQGKLAALVEKDPDVAYVVSTVGGGATSDATQGRMFVTLKPLETGRPSADVIAARLRHLQNKVPGIIATFQPVQTLNVAGRVPKASYQYTLRSADTDTLYDYAPKLQAAMRQIPILSDVTTDLQISQPQIRLHVDGELAGRMGVTDSAIRNTLYDLFGESQISTLYTATDDFWIMMETAPGVQKDASGLDSIFVRSTTGALVPLSSVATAERVVGPQSVNHQNEQPSVTLFFNVQPGASLGDAVDAIEKAEHDLRRPATISAGFSGTAQVFQESLGNQGILIAAAMLTIYVVLGVLYESFVHPITILVGLPSAAVGALLALMLFHMDLSVIAIIGIVMLIGIVKKNAILIVDFALQRRREGATAMVAIREACLMRFRPIIMTTFAALFGTLPIALGIGAGASLRQPLGIAVVGGLLLSQIITLYTTPVVYLLFERIGDRARRKKAVVADGAEPAQDLELAARR